MAKWESTKGKTTTCIYKKTLYRKLKIEQQSSWPDSVLQMKEQNNLQTVQVESQWHIFNKNGTTTFGIKTE
jgi:hypothetical protein